MNTLKVVTLLVLIPLGGCDDNSGITLAALELVPTQANIQPGGQQMFTATAKDAAGNELSDVPLEWSISNSSIATIEVDPVNGRTALAMGESPGTVEIMVASGGLSDASVLTIDASSSRPVEISRVFPEEGSTISNNRPEIGADVSYRRCDCGLDSLATIKLFLDGIDVTSASSMEGTTDIPQSGAGIIYIPPSPFSLGTHDVEVQITSSLGRSSTYSWSFQIE